MCGAGCAPNWVNPDSGTPGCGHAATRHDMYIWSFLINSTRGNTGLQGTGDGTNVATFDSNLSFEKCIFLPHIPTFQSWAAYCSHPGLKKQPFRGNNVATQHSVFFATLRNGARGRKGSCYHQRYKGRANVSKTGVNVLLQQLFRQL